MVFQANDHAEADRGLPGKDVIDLFPERGGPAQSLRVALIGTYAPRNCGIATFTTDIREKLGVHFPNISFDVYALDAADSQLVYDDDIHVIEAGSRDAYRQAARRINESGADAVWLQHEFGIFGGPDGEYIRDLVDGIAAPLVVTFHTVRAGPSAGQRAVMDHLLSRCVRVMVMSKHSRDLLISNYAARPQIIEIIEHGAPDRPFGTTDAAKARLGLAGRKVLTTFGLLGPGKGIETAIAALPAIIEQNPDVVYRILGATHPVLVAREGEAYRDGLIAQAEALGVADHIMWENRFLGIDELLEQLEACDVYLTPYPNLDQSTSGTLSYAVALGKAVVSTPYIHARELLTDGVGCLIATNSADAIANAVNGLFASHEALLATQTLAYMRGRRTIWPRFASAGAQLIRNTLVQMGDHVSPERVPGLSAVWSMSDATGMFQHAIGIVPDRRHGYCLDDNARALMLMNVASGMNGPEQLRWSAIYASFIQYAWNADERRFRNFMNFDRTWCESVGSEDSNGRALWALGHTVEHAPHADIRAWAQGLFDEVLKRMDDLPSPRAMAFAGLGALAVLRAGVDHPAARKLATQGCEFLTRLVAAERRPDWSWFEAVLGYDNPRLCQLLIEGGMVLDRPEWLATGLETLAWISACQTSAQGHFRPIGSESFGQFAGWQPFDQQPLEAQAAIEAAHQAWIATGEPMWAVHANKAYQWFFGANDRGVMLAEMGSGRCRDGVTPRGRNENCGAESILAFQLGHYAMASLSRAMKPNTPTGIRFGYNTTRDEPQSVAHS